LTVGRVVHRISVDQRERQKKNTNHLNFKFIDSYSIELNVDIIGSK
jgi:hypothetical protein